MNRIELEQNGATESRSDGGGQPTPTFSAKRLRLAGTIIALILIGALVIGFLSLAGPIPR